MILLICLTMRLSNWRTCRILTDWVLWLLITIELPVSIPILEVSFIFHHRIPRQSCEEFLFIYLFSSSYMKAWVVCFAEFLPKLHTLVLTNNRLVNLVEIDPLASLPRLQFLSLLDNNVTKKPNYRLYVIHKLKSLRVLDFKKIKNKVICYFFVFNQFSQTHVCGFMACCYFLSGYIHLIVGSMC